MEREKFKFLDASEERLWHVLNKAKIKFRASTSMFDRVRQQVIETPGMHHYEFDQFYDAADYGNAHMYSTFHNNMNDSIDQYVDCSMPNLNIKLSNNNQSYNMDTLDKLADLEVQGQELERELSVVGDKVTAYFYEANKVVDAAQTVTCDWNVLAGLKCQSRIDVLKQISARFDEKLASLRFQLSENRVQSILEELEAKYQEASKYAKKVLDEIKKLA